MLKMAGGLGFEPRLMGPEPIVLPLDDPPSVFFSIYNKLFSVKYFRILINWKEYLKYFIRIV